MGEEVALLSQDADSAEFVVLRGAFGVSRVDSCVVSPGILLEGFSEVHVCVGVYVSHGINAPTK